MARPGEGRRRRRDEEQLLLLLLARRRLRLARAGGASKVWALAIVELVLCVAALVAAAVTAGTAVQAALNDRTLSGRSAKPLPITSRVYARNGYYLGAIPSPVHGEPVEYDAMSPWIRKATVAAEDHTFWTNDGLDYTSIARAALADGEAGGSGRSTAAAACGIGRNGRVARGSRLHSAAGMAGERTKLVVAERERLGSAESRRLRKEGLVPGVLYGDGEPVAICIAERELRRALTGSAGLHAILDVEIDGKGNTHASILKEYQVDPVRGGVTHVDLQEVRLDQAISASVAVHLIGGEDAPGVREGGVLSQPLREVTVEALPLEVPERIELDVSGMEIGGTLRISDLTAPDGATLLDDPELVVATVTAPTRVVEPEPTEEELAELEAAEGEEGAEGEAAEGDSEAAAESEADASGDQGTDES